MTFPFFGAKGIFSGGNYVGFRGVQITSPSGLSPHEHDGCVFPDKNGSIALMIGD